MHYTPVFTALYYDIMSQQCFFHRYLVFLVLLYFALRPTEGILQIVQNKIDRVRTAGSHKMLYVRTPRATYIPLIE